MTGLEIDAALIKRLVEWSNLRPANIAKRIGVANTTINRHFAGTATTRLGRVTLDKLRDAFPGFPAWSDDNPEGVSLDSDDMAYVNVSVVPSYAGMGGGGSGEGDRLTAKLPRRLIEDELHGRAGDFEMIDVRGDSMKPDFLHGDQILYDKRDRDPVQPGAFVLWDGDGYVLKLVERVPRKKGWYRVFSKNDVYREYEIEEDQARILGRPVWFARRI